MGALTYLNGCLNKNGSYPFPSDDIDPTDKDKPDYNLGWSQAITWAYFDNRCDSEYGDYDRIAELRSYMEGRQSSGKYKDLLLGKVGGSKQRVDSNTKEIVEEGGSDREAWNNINYEEIYSCAPRMMNALLGKFEKISHDISVEALDEKSKFLKKQKKDAIWYDKKYKAERDTIRTKLGLEPKDEVLPGSKQELDLWETLGANKLAWEIAMEKCIGHTFNISDRREIARKVRHDLITTGKAATIDMVDIDAQIVREEYIDIADLIIEYDSRSNYSRSKFAAYPFWYTMTQVIEETGMEEDEVIKLATSVAGNFGNPSWSENFSQRHGGNWLFGDWKVPVLYSAWITTNKYYNTKVETKNLGKISYKEQFGKFYDGTKGSKETVETSVEVVYHCKWIPYSTVIWNYGMMNDIPRDESGLARLPFHVYKIKGKPIGEQMILPLDDMHLAHLIYQNNKAKSPPPGVAIDISSLANITYGTHKLSVKDIINLYYQTGNYLYSTSKAGQPPSAGQPKPFEILPGGNAFAIKEFADSLSLAFNDLANITGIDPVSLVNEIKSDIPVGNAKIGVEQMNDTLSMIYVADQSIEEDFCSNAASRIQLICMFNDDESKGYASIIGKGGVKAIAEARNKHHTYYGIRIFDKPSAQEKNNLLEALKLSLQPGKSGIPGITPSQYSFLSRQMNMPGGIKAAEQMLMYWEKSKMEQDMQASQQNMQANTQREGEIADKKIQGDIAVINAKTEGQLKVIAFQAMVDKAMDDATAERELQHYGVKLLANNIAQRSQAQNMPQQEQQGQPQQQPAQQGV